MSIYLSKNLKQKQSVKLTPSLKKSIDLLQLSRFELIKKIEEEIDENPFLEKDGDFSSVDGSYNQDFNFEIESKKTLRESLIEQLNDFNLNQKQTELSKIIIDCIDENGMLIEEIFEIEKLSKNIFNSNDIEEILVNVIQKMNPHGIVAFHDTAVIDGCREFIADLRIHNNGSYDVSDYPYGTNQRNCGITLITKPGYGDVKIDEICGSPSVPEDIYAKERKNFPPLDNWWQENLK